MFRSSTQQNQDHWFGSCQCRWEETTYVCYWESKKSEVFKNIKKLPCRYLSQRKSWMDCVLFEEWMRDVNKKFQAEGRKVALIIFNCPAHPVIENLSQAKLVFLPLNTTLVSQSMDQGVIRCLKAHYRKRSVKLILRSLDSDKPLLKVSVLNSFAIACISIERI